ncbi:hypothetical protein SBA7_270002 [Candidatus Sulfotelmatobacter sp. SbA7]|nr:hypothetical protein SBA7_270002 [Candidatus Sulfotelmatobacter sp. SbA7]
MAENLTGTEFTNALPPGRHVPQGLKPAFFQALGGTAEAVPYPNPFMKPVL